MFTFKDCTNIDHIFAHFNDVLLLIKQLTKSISLAAGGSIRTLWLLARCNDAAINVTFDLSLDDIFLHQVERVFEIVDFPHGASLVQIVQKCRCVKLISLSALLFDCAVGQGFIVAAVVIVICRQIDERLKPLIFGNQLMLPIQLLMIFFFLFF